MGGARHAKDIFLNLGDRATELTSPGDRTVPEDGLLRVMFIKDTQQVKVACGRAVTARDVGQDGTSPPTTLPVPISAPTVLLPLASQRHRWGQC